MKIFAPTLSAALLVSTIASANCTTDPIVTGGSSITNLISASLICGRPGVNYPGDASDRWQEQHRAGGQLWDHKLGGGVDPEVQVGTWDTQNGSSTTNYTANYFGNSFTYTVRQIGGSGITYSFCVGSAEYVVANVNAGQGSAGTGCSVFP